MPLEESVKNCLWFCLLTCGNLFQCIRGIVGRLPCSDPTFVSVSSAEKDTRRLLCSVWEPCIILKVIITLLPRPSLSLLDNSTSVILPLHIVFYKLGVLFMALLWPSPGFPWSSNIVLPDWTWYPGKTWPVWVEWKITSLLPLLLSITKTLGGIKYSESYNYLY